MQEFSLADYPAMPPVPSGELERSMETAPMTRRQLLGVGALMLTTGTYLGAIRGAHEAAFTPTDIKIGPHDAVIQMTTDHQENIDLGILGNFTKQTNWPADTGFSVRVQGIPIVDKTSSNRQQATANLINQYKEAIGNKHALSDAEHTFITRVWHDSLEGSIIGAAGGLTLFGLALGAQAGMSDRRRDAYREVFRIDSRGLRIAALIGGLAAATLIADGFTLPTLPGNHVTQNVDSHLSGTPLRGFAVQGEELQATVDYLVPLIKNEFNRNDAFYAQAVQNFKTAFQEKFGTNHIPHKDVKWVQKLSDNHCNMEMDAFHGAVARAFDDDLTLDTGDMTWWGSAAEEMCIAEEADNVVSHNPEAVVMGNHDSPIIAAAARKHKMIIIDNDKLTKVAGFTLLGQADVNSSDMGTTMHQRGKETTAEEAVRVKNAACELHPDIVMVHEHAEAEATAESGCTPETDYGHDHVEHNPYVTNAATGSIAMDAGTSGGAAHGSPTIGPPGKVATELECEYSADTHRLIGCYVISMQTDGSVSISDFIPNPATAVSLPVSEAPLADAPAK